LHWWSGYVIWLIALYKANNIYIYIYWIIVENVWAKSNCWYENKRFFNWNHGNGCLIDKLNWWMFNPYKEWRWKLYHLRRMLGRVDDQVNPNSDKKDVIHDDEGDIVT